jgi:hypothetical protein
MICSKILFWNIILYPFFVAPSIFVHSRCGAVQHHWLRYLMNEMQPASVCSAFKPLQPHVRHFLLYISTASTFCRRHSPCYFEVCDGLMFLALCQRARSLLIRVYIFYEKENATHAALDLSKIGITLSTGGASAPPSAPRAGIEWIIYLCAFGCAASGGAAPKNASRS